MSNPARNDSARSWRLAPLDRKLLRELWKSRGQALAIGMVVAAGVALYVLMLSAFESLELTQRTYYERYRFADVFASARRAPLGLQGRIAAIPGVTAVEPRVVAQVTLDVENFVEPVSAKIVGVPDDRRPMINDLFISDGRYLDPGQRDEVLVSDAFAAAHGLGPGDSIGALINGRRRELEIVGRALSPEFIYTVPPGSLMVDDERYAILWMDRRALGAAFDVEGGFNDVVLALRSDASERAVIDQLDAILRPYGGLGAIPRAQQESHLYLESELTGLRSMGTAMPLMFLTVAAFLLNMVLSRMIAVQREEIAVVKAVGYSNRAVALHFLKWSVLIAGAGGALGVLAGALLGRAMTELYTEFFRFPILTYRLGPNLIVQAVSISLAAAVVGTLTAVRRVLALPPAEAMRPAPPAEYRQSWVETLGLKRWLSQPTRMILRNLQRQPGRAALSIAGVAGGCALMVFGTFSADIVDVLIDVEFNTARRYDVAVTFVEPVSASAYYELQRVPGVMEVEPFRSVPARLRFGHRFRTTSISGTLPDARLSRIVDASFEVVEIPARGLVLSATLADLIGASRGDVVTVEVLEGQRPVRQEVVTAIVDDLMGSNAYMGMDSVRRLMRESGSLSGAYLSVDPGAMDDLFLDLKHTPQVAGVTSKESLVAGFEATIAETFVIMRAFAAVFAGIIAFGVVYNTARISLSERGRELASLRVLGLTRGEISYILLGELGVLTLIAIPLGMAGGYALSAALVQASATELFRLPMAVSAGTYTLAALTVLAATLISSFIVRRKLNRLDLIEVLKTRE